MTTELKRKIIENTFVDKVRMHMIFDKKEYYQLCMALTELANSLKGSSVVDRELMLYLYAAPMLIRNSFESLPEKNVEIAQKLEDAWIELDRLVTDCLVD